MPDLRFDTAAKVVKADVNVVAQNHDADVVYLDPPYSERQYVDCYHVLENIASWEKPALSGRTMKFERTTLKSDYSRRSTALEAFKQLIQRVRARFIFVSYSNEGIIPIGDLKETLSLRGVTTIASKDYSVFGNGAGQSERRSVVEYLATCRVET